MSFGNGSSFYSAPHPERIGSPVNEPRPPVQTIDNRPLEDHGELDRVNVVPIRAAAPPYARYSDTGVDTFAPSTGIPEAFKPELVPAPNPGGFPAPWVWIAAAGLIWVLSRENR